MLLLDMTIVVVALPEVQATLHASFPDLEWVVDAYALSLASLLLTSGVLADRYGRRRLFTVGLVIFTVCSAICGAAQSPLMLVLSRAAQGVGGAIVFATSLALLAQAFQGKDRGIAFGIWGAITGIAVSLGPVLGGAITTGISWRAIFWVNVPVGALAIAVTLWQVEESREAHPPRPDWAGFVLLTAGLVGVVYGLIEAGETSWATTRVVVSLAAGGALLAGFIAAEAVSSHPVFDLRLFGVPTFDGGLLAGVTMNGSLFAVLLYLVLYLQDILGYSALGAGLRLLVSSGAMFVAAAISGRLSELVPVRWLIGPGLALVCAGLLFMTGVTGRSSWTHLLAGLVVSGVGAGMVNPPLASTAVGVVAPERAGMASGVNSTFRQVGFATSLAALGTVFTSELHGRLATRLARVPALAARSGEVASLLKQGEAGAAVSAAPPRLRGELAAAIRSSFAGGLDELLVIAAAIAAIGALGSVVLVRRSDFASRRPVAEITEEPGAPQQPHAGTALSSLEGSPTGSEPL
jgi:EmrB/QacA subfamily drug resistance transporter